MSEPGREQGLVFGEVAEQYDEARPGYPDAVFDAIMEFGGLQPGDRALEIGAGTGKATLPFVARGLDITALEPSPGMAAVLRAKGVEAVEERFDTFTAGRPFPLVFGAQSWHWVLSDGRYARAAAALRPGGTFAVFWNLGEEWTGALGAQNDACYRKYAPHLSHAVRNWNLDHVLDAITAEPGFESAEKRVIPWTETYTRAEYVRLLGTHSDHRILPEDTRAALHEAVGDVIDAHGGSVAVNYDVNLYLASRRRGVSRRGGGRRRV